MELPDYDPGTDDSKRCWQNMIDVALNQHHEENNDTTGSN